MRNRRHLLGLAVALALLQGAARADRAPAAARASLKNVAVEKKMRVYDRKLGSGVERTYVNADSSDKLAAIEHEHKAGSGVLEIVHMGQSNANHTMAIFDRRLLHFQYANGTGNWRLRSWGDRLRPSGRRLYSAAIQLTDGEAGRLREMLARAEQQQGPEATAGASWERGHVGDAMGTPSLNCVAGWCDARIGEHGEPLWQLVGLPRSYSGDPRGFQQALERQANDRVFGIHLYGPEDLQFGTKPDEDQVKF